MIGSKISKKYFLISLVVILLTLAGVYGFTVQIMNSSFREQIGLRDELISRSLAKRIDFILRMMINDMRVASIHSLDRQRQGRSIFFEEVQKMLARQPLYLFIQSVSAEGELLSRIPDPRHLEAFPAEQIIDRLSWSKTYFISNMTVLPDGKQTFVVAYPVLDEGGIFKGGVMAFVDLEVLSGYLSESRIGAEGVVALLDREGTIIAHSAESRIGDSLYSHPLARHLQLERYGVWEGTLFDRKMLIAYRPMFYGTFGLFVGESTRQAWAPSDRVMVILVQGFTAVLLVSAGLTLFGTSRLVKPITALIRQTSEYKENKRSGFDPVTTGDEIEDLSRTLDQMAKALTERERRLFYILESIPYAVITIDKEGVVTTFNRSAEDLTGFERSEVVGRSIFALPIKASKEEFISWQTLREGKAFDDVETYIFDKQKNRLDVRMHSALYEGEDRKPQGAIIVFRDVSDVKKLEEYLRKSEQLAALGQLTAGIAHEIKNPLSIIQAAAEGIQLEIEDATDKDSVQGLVDDILKTSDRMNGLIKDFLSMSMVPEETQFQPIDLISIVKELLHLLLKKFQDQRIEVIWESEHRTALVNGNKNGMTQVFLNILLNSLQAMKEGGTLRVEVVLVDNAWKLVFADTGSGIPQEKLPWIFNPFFSTKSDGTGLGLSIAHEIVTEHQGEIRAESVEGQGTTLIVQLPRSEQGPAT